MTASTVSSTAIINKLAVSSVAAVTYSALGNESDARTKTITGTIELATTSIDETGDIALLFPVQGNHRLVSLVIFNDDMDSNGTPTLAADVGLYKDPNAAGTSATAVSATAYATAITTLQSANTTGVEIAFEARNIDKMGQTVAVDGGESEHSKVRYVGLTITTTAATPVAGTLTWRAIVSVP